MIALVNAVEPLRMANILTRQPVYEWSIVSADGTPTPSSNGLQLSPTLALEQLGSVDILFVCGGVDVQAAVSPRILAALKRLAERRVPLGALCTGGYALAKAGLLERYRASIHWENLSALREEFPRIQLNDQLFTIDRDRFTCSGGVAPLDLMLHLVEAKLGAQVSQLISEQFIVDRVRSDRDR
ncbi:MAG: AraC family transcriptional regulator, partial [Gammaproteobacteria bacterium]|nr:AraC family transcriptional regulator [Gammaproteobacteria bacterium]